MSELVLTDLDDHGVLTLTLNRPDKRNALSLDLIEALRNAVEHAHGNDDVRAVILTGAGKSFCAGMDLHGVIDDVEAMSRMLQTLALTSVRLRALPVPTISKVNGAAVGGGCGLMVVTDFAITHPDAKVGYPEVDLGLCPAVVAPLLIRKIGAGRARAMLLGGGTMSGEAAHRRGLADRLVARDELDAAATDLARRFAAGGPDAIATTKRWLNELDGSLDEEIARRAASLSARVIAGEEAQSRLRSILGK